MSSIITELEQVTGASLGTGIGFGLALTAQPALTPLSTALKQTAWEADPNLAPNVFLLAEGVAQGQIDPDKARPWAHAQGISDDAFAALVAIANVGPGAAYGFQLWRRGIIGESGFERVLKRLGMEAEWVADLKGLKNVLLTPAELANARQQGFVDEARQKAEADLQGITDDRAEIQFKLSGLPPGVDVGQHAANRGLIDEATFAEIVREGHTKTKYTDLLWKLRHPILSAPEYATLHLKGWISDTEMNDGGALSGFTQEQMNLLFLARGRPAAPGQMATAAARGIDGPDGSPMDEAQFLKGIRESDIRPEWGPMLWKSRYLYPPLFQLTRLVTAGTINADTAADWAKKDRYAPEVVTALHKAWSAGAATTTAADPHVTKAQNQLWTATHSSYVKDRTDDATAQTKLAALGVAAGAIPAVLALWQEERELVRAGLTPAQIKKAFGEATFTQPEAVARLVELGWSAADATVYLGE